MRYSTHEEFNTSFLYPKLYKPAEGMVEGKASLFIYCNTFHTLGQFNVLYGDGDWGGVMYWSFKLSHM